MSESLLVRDVMRIGVATASWPILSLMSRRR